LTVFADRQREGGRVLNLPIWATVFISGIVGGWVGRALSSLVFLPLMLGGTGAHTLASNWVLVVALAGLGQVAVTSLALWMLLSPLSDVRVGFPTTFIATLVGNLVAVVGTLVLLRAAVQSSLAGGGGVGVFPAFGLLSLVFAAVGIVITATMIGSAASSDGGGGRLEMYGGQSYLDEYRKGEQP
jgi:hypothetical protein